MPAIDNLFGNGAIHISDRNKKHPVATLCGQALDKETIRYFENVDNFDQATCKVCRKSFFDEAWNGEANTRSDSTNVQDTPAEEAVQEPAQAQSQTQALVEPTVEADRPRSTLFGGLKTPVNSHSQGEKSDGD